ncbi:hypothetical protein X474_09875 [Dethiosulfatarculus sandiegensis]|uniref:Uncharacterized protein n=1 Tax=Dethiosulfatarculus sandiegensis TaxID=1429043 RepID=A0A0D2JFE3_9BACT|nr:hypothetical protein X474_09875 [Dethiosulfatarculus sandiegensis]
MVGYEAKGPAVWQANFPEFDLMPLGKKTGFAKRPVQAVCKRSAGAFDL